MKLVDLPESLHLYAFQFLIDPSSLLYAYRILTLSRQFSLEIKKFIKQEIQTKTSLNRYVQYLEHEYTLQLYACTLNSCLFLIGGVPDNRRCDLFHTISGKFKRICSLGLKRSEEFDAIGYRGYVFAISGTEDPAAGSIEVYDIFYNRWHVFPSLPMKIAASSSIVFNDKLYIIGGVDRVSSARSNRIYELTHDASFGNFGKLSTNYLNPHIPPFGNLASSPQVTHHVNFALHCKWDLSSFNLLTGRSHHSVVVYRNCLWIAGGLSTGQWLATNTTEILNPLTGTSIQGPPMLRTRLQPKLLVIDDILYAVGGDMEGTVRSVSSIERYDNEKQSWQYVTFFLDPRRRSKCAVAAFDHKIYIFGGAGDGGTPLTSWDYFNTRTKLWASHVQSFLKENKLPPSESDHRVTISAEEKDFLLSVDLSVIPTRVTGDTITGVKSALAVPLSFS
jgi:hypothetical protein